MWTYKMMCPGPPRWMCLNRNWIEIEFCFYFEANTPNRKPSVGDSSFARLPRVSAAAASQPSRENRRVNWVAERRAITRLDQACFRQEPLSQTRVRLLELNGGFVVSNVTSDRRAEVVEPKQLKRCGLGLFVLCGVERGRSPSRRLSR